MTHLAIRDMTPADFDACIKLGRHAHAESSFKIYDWDEERLRVILHICNTETDLVAWCVTDYDKIVGYMLAQVTQMFFGKDLAASDINVYIAPDYRGTVAAVRLLKRYVKWARAKKVAVCCLGCGTMVNEDRTAKFYNRLGFEQCGTQHKMVM